MRAGVLPAVTIDGEEDRYCSGTHGAVTSLTILNVMPSFVLQIRCQVVGDVLNIQKTPSAEVLSFRVQRGLGDQVGIQDGPLMPEESGTRSPKCSPVLLPIADPTPGHG